MKLFKIFFTYNGRNKYKDIISANDKSEAIDNFNHKYEKEQSELVPKIYKIKEIK